MAKSTTPTTRPVAKGSMRLSKSKKAIMIYIEGQQPTMVSVKSMRKLLDNETPYIKVWSTTIKEERPRNDREQK
jgi:hypothetical protein